MNVLRPVLFLVLMVSVKSSYAETPWHMTESEFASMPAVCKARAGVGGQYNHWKSMMGPGFDHTHHYCLGINFLSRAYKAKSARDKGFNLNNARTNLMYMVNAAPPTYSLMPDVYLNLGIVYRMSGRPGEAATSFIKAIELNPRLPGAYRELADFYSTTGNRAKALEVVTEGLRYNPDIKSLQRNYRELGGKLPYPEAVDKSEITEEKKDLVKPEEKPDTTQPASEPASETADDKGVTSQIEQTPQAVPPKIGSPNNPYCRFCPD
jgi:tetratricopeptide (TPR) repeat protein